MTALTVITGRAPPDAGRDSETVAALIKAASTSEKSVQAALTIAATPTLKDAACQLLDRLNAALQPASPEEIVRELRKLLSVYAVADGKNKTHNQWNDFWDIYCLALDDLPLSAIRAGMRRLTREWSSDFYPKPNAIRELCSDRHFEMIAARDLLAYALSCEPMPHDLPEYRKERFIEVATQKFVLARCKARPAAISSPPDLGFV